MTYQKGGTIKFRNGDKTLTGVIENTVDNLAIDTEDEDKITHILVSSPEFSGYVHIDNIIKEDN